MGNEVWGGYNVRDEEKEGWVVVDGTGHMEGHVFSWVPRESDLGNHERRKLDVRMILRVWDERVRGREL
jgi:hypothetical protein